MKSYFLVNSATKISRGKVAAQVGHAAAMLEVNLFKQNPKLYHIYHKLGHGKIVLKAEPQIIKLCQQKYDQQSITIYDQGLTQCKPQTLTVLGFYPTTNIIPEIKDLKLY